MKNQVKSYSGVGDQRKSCIKIERLIKNNGVRDQIKYCSKVIYKPKVLYKVIE